MKSNFNSGCKCCKKIKAGIYPFFKSGEQYFICVESFSEKEKNENILINNCPHCGITILLPNTKVITFKKNKDKTVTVSMKTLKN